MGRDLLLRPYGRFYNLAKELAELGHEVHGLYFSYVQGEEERFTKADMVMESVSIPPLILPAWQKAKQSAEQFRPDWVIGFSDTWFGIMAQKLAQISNAKALIDAYDNFEAYIPGALPVHWWWRNALNRADVVTCAGPSLATLLGQHCNPDNITVIPMSADKEILSDLPKIECRQKLGLKQEQKLVGCHGSLYQSRDIDTFFQAARLVHEIDPDIGFVTSGRVDKNTSLPDFFNHLGYLADSDIPYLVNSLDTLVVPNKDNRFGNYSYPVKICEGMACGLPMVVTRTASTQEMLKAFPEMLVEPGDAQDMANGIQLALQKSEQKYPPVPSWRENALQLQSLLLDS